MPCVFDCEINDWMFVRLTRAKRLKAGWLLALAYVLCVLAPGVSFAFSEGGHAHDHSGIHAHLSQSDSCSDIKTVGAETPVPVNGQHDILGAHCCGMMCVIALPATVMMIVNPIELTSACASENYRGVVDNTPSRLYRPPIS